MEKKLAGAADATRPELPRDPGSELAEALNRDCHCISLDEGELGRALAARLGEGGARPGLFDSHPTLLAASPVFLSRGQVERMSAIIGAVEAVVSTPAYRQEVLAEAPAIARDGRASSSVFLGYDFHLALDGPRLIEINTNPGGGLLSLYLASAQRACCDEVRRLVAGDIDLAGLETALIEMFRDAWRQQRGERPLGRVAIIDEDPGQQFLYPEFLLFQRLFEAHGIDAVIAAPETLEYRDGTLVLDGRTVDLVYNRLTDFYLESPEAAALRAAYCDGTAVVTPDPHAHALYANKRNLVLLSDPERLRALGVEEAHVETLAAGVPRTLLVTPERADELWSGRRRLFFKPLTGYGSRGAYRGAGLTRRVWQSILAGGYVAQEVVPPSKRQLLIDGDAQALKLDLRCFVYAGQIQLLAARLYAGQTTNLRTVGGGLASVFTTPPGA